MRREHQRRRCFFGKVLVAVRVSLSPWMITLLVVVQGQRFTARKRGRRIHMQSVNVMEISSGDLRMNDPTAMLQRSESDPSSGTLKKFADRSQECPCKGENEVLYSDEVHTFHA